MSAWNNYGSPFNQGRFDTTKVLIAEKALLNYYGQDEEDYPTRDEGLREIRALEDRVRFLEDFCANFRLEGWEAR